MSLNEKTITVGGQPYSVGYLGDLDQIAATDATTLWRQTRSATYMVRDHREKYEPKHAAGTHVLDEAVDSMERQLKVLLRVTRNGQDLLERYVDRIQQGTVTQYAGKHVA